MIAVASKISREPLFDLDEQNDVPLWPLEVVMFFTRKNEDAVLNLIHRKLLEFAFDIRTKSAARRGEVRVLGDSVKKYLRGEAVADRKISQKEIDAAIASILPKVNSAQLPFATIRANELARRFFCSRFHVHNLIEDKLLACTRAENGPRISPYVLQTSAVALLEERRIA